MEHREFLDRLFPNVPNNTRILIHELPLKRSSFFETPEQAANYVDNQVKGKQNIYTTAGLIRPGLPSGRGKKKDIMGVVAMGIDIDLKRPNKPGGVDTIEQAKALVKGYGWNPTLIIDTGNGIHCWWLFKEALMFANEEERQAHELRCRRLQETIRRRAKEHDWDIDSTHEVNRVLRLPGTYNRKDPASPLKVKLIEDSGREYGDPENYFEEFIIPEDQLPIKSQSNSIPDTEIKKILDDVKINPNATAPLDLLEAIFEIEPQLRLTWQGMRTDMNDNSPSGHVYAMLPKLIEAGFTDQQLADCVVVFYRDNHHSPIDRLKPVNRPAWVAEEILKAKAATSSPADPAGPAKVQVDMKSRDLKDLSKKFFASVNLTNDPPRIFEMASEISRMTIQPGERPSINILNKFDIRHEFVARADCYKLVKNEKVSDFPSEAICNEIIAYPDPPLLKLSAIVENPYYSAGFTCIMHPGYFKPAAIFYHNATDMVIPPVPDQPTASEIDQAKDLIFENLLANFPFVDDSDKANALSILLLPLVRNLIDGITPLHAVMAPTPRTGKTLLCDLLILTAQGHEAVKTSAPVRDEEWTKKLTAILSDLPTFIYFDNVTRKLDSGELSLAITSRNYGDRILGKTKFVKFPVNCVWIATGNNLRFSSEIVNRVVPIRLDAQIADPSSRISFKIPDIRSWTLHNRAGLLWSVMVFANNWRAQGMPAPKNIKHHMGGFEQYIRVIGGILECNGIAGFLDNRDDFRGKSDEEGFVLEEFVGAWFSAHGADEVFVSDLLNLIESQGVPVPIGRGDYRSKTTNLGHFIKSILDRHVDDFAIRKKATKSKGKTQYYLEKIAKDAADKCRNVISLDRS